MRREHVAVVRQGRRYRLGRTSAYGGIWRKRPWGWRLVARYPLNDEGWRIAEGQFSMWEPDAPFVANPGPAPGAPQGQDGPGGGPVAQPPRRRLGAVGWGAVVIAVLVLAAAGVLTDHFVAVPSVPSASRSVTPKTFTRPPVGGGWLASGSGWVVFIQWSSTRNTFDGTAQSVQLSGAPPTLKLTTTAIPVTGKLKGDRITISFQGRAEQFGTVAKGRFTVNFPQSTGTLAPVTFVAASAARYNRVIGALRARVTGANVSAEEAAARAKAETSINQSATGVLSDIAALATDETLLTHAVTSIQGPLSSVNQGLATIQGAVAGVNSCFTYVTNAVSYDATSIGYDTSSVSGSSSGVESDVTTIQDELSTLKTATAGLKAKESALPGYNPPNQPVPTAVTKAIATAQADVASAVSTTNNDIAQANSDLKAAFADADQAYRSAGCTTPTTTGPQSPPPIPPITS